ncbi:MAG: twin-arginine translocation signal domain-containing protein [Dehalococcoidia bacterium]|nr:MAG: twin-arginine translocation signal domain-containing protein [Dehalococcoidia bacterium]
MEVNRRNFLKASGAGLGGLFLFGAFNDDAIMARTLKKVPLKKKIGEVSTICPYDASGCGFIVAAENDKIVNLEGDPDHPINNGAACSKGASLAQLHNNERRLSKVLYRRPRASDWEEVSWDFALDKIARKIKDTRDADFIQTNSQGNLVNRTEAIASVGGAAHDNEECYLLIKMLRALGLVYIEHQARI